MPFDRLQFKLKENERKTPMDVGGAMAVLSFLFPDVYDVNLYVYKALSHQTIIDIQYYRKSSLTRRYQEHGKESPPMIHCKVSRPFKERDATEKFDINWEHSYND